MTNFENHLKLDQPAIYHIRVVGRLEEDWSDYLGGLTIEVHTDGEQPAITCLTGSIADQAGLHGLLRRIRDLGLPLLMVECLHSAD